MVDPRVVTQVRIHIAAGIGEEHIRKVLSIEGLSQAEISEALLAGSVPVPPPLPTPSPISTAPASVPTMAPFLSVTPLPQVRAAETHVLTETVVMPHAGKSRLRLLIVTVLAAALLLLGGGGVYAYTQNLISIPSLSGILMRLGFGSAPYTEDNFVSGLLETSSRIKSGSYSASASLAVVPRDEGARPFEILISNEEELREQYQNDSQRVRDISALLSGLERAGRYPASLQSVIATARSQSGRYADWTFTDPKTDMPYSYRLTKNGTDFALTATFETKQAVSQLQRSTSYASSTVLVVGQTVTFTRDSNQYFYFPSEPPTPFLVSLGEMARFLPAELAAQFSVSASADWSEGGSGDWKFNMDASGDFGDLTYKVNADALRKDGDFYVRINNIPSIFGQYLSGNKGVWIRIRPSDATSTVGVLNQFSHLAEELPEAEEEYKKYREEYVRFVRAIAKIADEEKVLAFETPPYAESVDGVSLYRYDLTIRKESIIPFYKRVVEEAKQHEQFRHSGLYVDQGLVDYLESDEFTQIFDYVETYTRYTIWVDAAGYPRNYELAMRIVPPDTAVQLAKKQANLIFKAAFSDINKSIVVEAPEDARPIQELIQELEDNLNYSLGNARSNGRDARRIADIKQLQLALELYYSDKSAYPSALAALAPQYIAAVPYDPSTSAPYRYAARLVGGQCVSYHLAATLEETNSALSSDADSRAQTVCTGSASDFSGTDPLYDVTP